MIERYERNPFTREMIIMNPSPLTIEVWELFKEMGEIKKKLKHTQAVTIKDPLSPNSSYTVYTWERSERLDEIERRIEEIRREVAKTC